MAISLTAIATASAKSVNSLAITVPVGGVPTGSLIVVCVSESSTGGTTSASDSKSNTYINAGGGVAIGTSSGHANLLYAYNSTALVSGDTITVTLAQTGKTAAASAFYATSIQTSSDPGYFVAGSSGSSATPSVQPAANMTVGDLMVAMVATNGPSGDTFTQDTTDGFAAPPTRAGTSGGSATANWTIAGGFLVNAAGGRPTYQPSITSRSWGALAIAFKAGGPSGAVAESGSAADSPSAAQTQVSSAAESGAAADLPTALQTQVSSVAESGSASDTTNASITFAVSASESGSAVDSASASQVQVSSTAEAGSASDSPSATQTQRASVAESGSAVDVESAAVSGGTISVSITESGIASDTVSASIVRTSPTPAGRHHRHNLGRKRFGIEINGRLITADTREELAAKYAKLREENPAISIPEEPIAVPVELEENNEPSLEAAKTEIGGLFGLDSSQAYSRPIVIPVASPISAAQEMIAARMRVQAVAAAQAHQRLQKLLDEEDEQIVNWLVEHA